MLLYHVTFNETVMLKAVKIVKYSLRVPLVGSFIVYQPYTVIDKRDNGG